MDVEPFLSSLLDALADRPFVRSVDLETEVIILRGRVLLEQDRFLQVYFNEETGTTAMALIEDEQRIWGVDYDDLRGWHVHPVDDPDQHRVKSWRRWQMPGRSCRNSAPASPRVEHGGEWGGGGHLGRRSDSRGANAPDPGGMAPLSVGRDEYPDQSLVVLEAQQTRIRRFPPEEDDD